MLSTPSDARPRSTPLGARTPRQTPRCQSESQRCVLLSQPRLTADGCSGKPSEGEFEFLPPVKNVIVLDDAESNAPDEPWEYISSVGGDDEARKIFSYAEIVSKAT